MNTNRLPHDQSVLDFIAEKYMETQTQKLTEHKFSTQMCAALLIFSADPDLMELVAPHINLETESIHWDKIFKIPFSSGHHAAMLWAYGCWTDSQPDCGDCFDAALDMSAPLKIAVLEALCLRWGLRG